MENSELGERMKLYEGQEANRILMPGLPVMARLDGRAFHTFCSGLRKPYDERMIGLMANTTKYLVDETNATVGYCQSDEISLVWYSTDPEAQTFFGGRVQKLTSVLASMATLRFNQKLSLYLPEKADWSPLFDCRVWNVPNREEAANTLLWRELDATRNSINAAGQANFSHKSLQGKNTSQVQEMLWSEKGINWNDYPPEFKRGVWFKKRRVTRPYTTDELAKLPRKHQAHSNPDLVVERQEVVSPNWPPFRKITNRVAVLFEDSIPALDNPVV